MGIQIIKNLKMKFALLVAAVAAQTVCTDDDAADTCGDGCCGYLSPAEGDATRACGDGTKAAAADYDGTDTFSCDAPAAADGSSKIALGAAAVISALYLA